MIESLKNSKLKNSIVLKGMASNMVDEAIVILKPNVKINKSINKDLKHKEKKISRNLIIKEAEDVINEYMNKINERQINRELQKMQIKINILKITNFMFMGILVISLILNNI